MNTTTLRQRISAAQRRFAAAQIAYMQSGGFDGSPEEVAMEAASQKLNQLLRAYIGVKEAA